MATTTNTMGRNPNDPQVRGKNNALYWGIAAAVIVVLAILFSMRNTARDTMTPSQSMSAPANQNTGNTGSTMNRYSVNGAATSAPTNSTTETNSNTTQVPAETAPTR